MAWAHNITQKVMNASRALLASSSVTGIPASSIYAGIDDENLTNPRIICRCQEANILEEAPFSGNWIARLEIVVRSNADDIEPDAHFDLAGHAFSVFFTGTEVTDLSAAIPDFTVFQIVPRRQTYDLEGRSWVSILTLDVACCGSTIQES